MSTVEEFLTRELDIRFIDAREIANEAKIALGITGYPTAAERRMVRQYMVYILKRRTPPGELSSIFTEMPIICPDGADMLQTLPV